jgi:dephospho-CoA kinase
MIVGLTGGIASGKSLVADFLRESGIPVIDTDEIARQVVAPGQPAWHQLRAQFGSAYFLPSGELDRAALARLVFADPAARQRLEAITHPAIFAAVDECIAEFHAAPAPPAVIVVAVPLLFEVGAEMRFDRIVVVYATREQQRTRLMTTRGYTAAEAEARLSAQLSLEEKVRRADVVLNNSGTPADTRAQVETLVAQWQSREREGPPEQ